MTTVEPASAPTDLLVEVNDVFTTVAGAGGLAAPLLLVGSLVMAVSIAIPGVLTLGAVVDAVTPD